MHKINYFPTIDGTIGWVDLSPYKAQTLHPSASDTANLFSQHYDFAIIGAGFTGISIALRLAELNPQYTIALIDALHVGEGSSGRNAGFIIDVPHAIGGDSTGIAYNQNLYQLNRFAIDRLETYKNRFEIDCGWQQAGKYLAGHETKHLGRLTEFSAALKACALDYEYFEGAALSARLGTDYYQAALYTPDNILVNPAALVRGLTRALPESVTLFETTPITAIDYGTPHRLLSDQGTLSATTVIQAANGYNDQLGKLNNKIVPCFTYASLTEPLSETERTEFFNNIAPWGVTSTHPAGSTVRLTHDHRIFIRNKFDYAGEMRSNHTLLAKARAMHAQSFKARFPFLGAPKFTHTWGGIVAVTRNLNPIFTQLATNCYGIVGCNGVGIARGTYLGYYMADHIHGIKSPALDFILSKAPPKRIPPKPLTAVGARLRLYYEALSAKKEI